MTPDDAMQWVTLDAVADQLAAFDELRRTDIPPFARGASPIELRDALVALRRTLLTVAPADGDSSRVLLRRAAALADRIDDLMTTRYPTPVARDLGTPRVCEARPSA